MTGVAANIFSYISADIMMPISESLLTELSAGRPFSKKIPVLFAFFDNFAIFRKSKIRDLSLI